MRLTIIRILILWGSCSLPWRAVAETAMPDSLPAQRKTEYQIHLPHPAKSIRLLLDDRSMLPVRGRISEDKKSVILPDYEKGQKIRLKVEYEDGSVEELIKSPCYIDPVVMLRQAPRTGRILRPGGSGPW